MRYFVKFIKPIEFEEAVRVTIDHHAVWVSGHQESLTLDAKDIELNCGVICFIDEISELIVGIAASNIAYITTIRG